MRITVKRWLCWLAGGLSLLSGMVLADTQVQDSTGIHHFNAVPKRVITLSWEATDEVLALGITPIAAADAVDYRRWVVQPTLPASTLEIGSRLEPNLELILSLKPDLIIINPVLRDMQPQLSRIAPVLMFDAYRMDHDNAAYARQVYLELARLFGRQALAQQRIREMDGRVEQLRARLHQHFGPTLPKVEILRFAGPASVYLFGENSMPIKALQMLGVPNPGRKTMSAWGITSMPITALGQFGDRIVLHQEPFDQSDKLFPTPLWQAMPFVKAHHFAAVRSIWSYSGFFSLYYLADAITDALLTLPASPAR